MARKKKGGKKGKQQNKQPTPDQKEKKAMDVTVSVEPEVPDQTVSQASPSSFDEDSEKEVLLDAPTKEEVAKSPTEESAAFADDQGGAGEEAPPTSNQDNNEDSGFETPENSQTEEEVAFKPDDTTAQLQKVPSLQDMAKNFVGKKDAEVAVEKVKEWERDGGALAAPQRVPSLQDMAKAFVDEEAAAKATEQVKHWDSSPEEAEEGRLSSEVPPEAVDSEKGEEKVKKIPSLQDLTLGKVEQQAASNALEQVKQWNPPTIREVQEQGSEKKPDKASLAARLEARKSTSKLSLDLADIEQQGDVKVPREQAEIAGVGVDLDNFLSKEAQDVVSEYDENSHPASPAEPMHPKTPKDMSSYSYTTILPGCVLDNTSLLNDHELGLATMLAECGQKHLFDDWSLPPHNEKEKHNFFEQVDSVHSSCGKDGIPGYVERAKTLLAAAQKGENPLEGWTPSVPEGKALVPGSPEYYEYEEKGLSHVGDCCFVIVAGGLGERLGYSGIKLGLPSETTTGTCYLELYAAYILALQAKHSSRPLPLAIMVSQDTFQGTKRLLEEHGYFGLEESQVTLLLQEKVPALQDNDARIALASGDPYRMETKPHGHGDVHALLHADGAGVVHRWMEEGRKYVVFLQDTNGLALFSLPAVLGVSATLELQVNSLAIPRKAKQAIGAITKLTHADGREMTLNVEYNQLEPLLKSTINPEGDTNENKTGYSPFPGNINQLVFEIQPYCETLQKTGGMLPEFVNPKYADDAKITFKKPTRLECMMQEYPRVLDGEARVGFTSLPEWICFSPCKNSLEEARAALKKGVPPACASFAEADQYYVYAELLRTLEASVLKAPVKEVEGIPVQMGPAIVFDASFCGSLTELKHHFPEPHNIMISARSSLVIKGADIKIFSLKLDGALWIEVEEDGELIIKDLQVTNKGWEMADLDDSATETDIIRGYKLQKIEQEEIRVSADDGTVVIESEDSSLKEEPTVQSVEVSMEQITIASTEEVELKVPAGEPDTLNSVELPEKLIAHKELFDHSEIALLELLVECGQEHLFEKWSPLPDQNTEEKKAMIQQLLKCHESYPVEGGLRAYLQRSRELLAEAKEGKNPLEGWTPSVPTGGVNLHPGTNQYDEFEELGLSEIYGCCFVFVAGGLGERLGFSGIKLSLPTETITNKSYIELYIRQILALQQRYSSNLALPVAIMVSDDTYAGTKALLEMYQYFGMEKDQITLLKQEKVPALQDNEGRIALNPTNPYRIQAKPHGHGDVHALLHSSGLAKQWLIEGRKWVILAQDTNGLAFYTLPACIGVSKSLELKVNSVAIPRKGKQAIGGIATLEHGESGRKMTVNVEYNQLEPLLKATVSPEGDKNDPATGYSPYPGNINQLVFELDSYYNTLEQTKGVLGEFVNPKYADEARTTFKKPARLECMMQDYPKALPGDVLVGFTTLPEWICFSPCKNSIQEAKAAISKGVPPACAASAEQDQYNVFAEMLRVMGANVHRSSPKPICDIPIAIGPSIVFDPSFATCFSEVTKRFPNPENITISSRSTLIIRGNGVIIESLNLDGALFIDVVEGSSLTIKNLTVHNASYKVVPLGPDSNAENTPEVIRIRGYSVGKMDCKEIFILNAGEEIVMDGSESDDPESFRQQEKAKEKGCMVSMARWLGLKK